MLAEATGHGWGFLAAYGLTWLACAVGWRRWGAQVGAYCTLFQGMLALPLALLLTAVTPGPDRPSMAGMDDVSVLLASGQLLGLPIVIHLVTRRRFTDVPRAMVIILVVHFAPYTWLYATPLYLVMGAWCPPPPWSPRPLPTGTRRRPLRATTPVPCACA